MEPAHRTITRVLHAVHAGDSDARLKLVELVYAELRNMAGGIMAGQRPNSLQPTILAHDAIERLGLLPGDVAGGFENRAHFFGAASIAMYRILVDHAKARKTQKRGGNLDRRPLDDVLDSFTSHQLDFTDLHEAIEELRQLEPRQADVITYRFFGGMQNKEIAHALVVSEGTVERDLRLAKAWLHNRLKNGWQL